MIFDMTRRTGGSVQTASGTFTGTNYADVTISVPFEPDMVVIWRSDIDNMTAIADQANAISAIARDLFMFFSRTNANATQIIAGGATTATGAVSTSRPTENYFTWSNNSLYYKCNQGNGALFRSALQYTYYCIKYT